MLDKVNEFFAKPMAQQALFFNEMLTPKLIRIAYWLCLVVVLWEGLCRMFSNGFSGFIGGIVFIAVGAIFARVGAELIILFFKINENMGVVAENSVAPSPVKRKATKKVSKKAT